MTKSALADICWRPSLELGEGADLQENTVFSLVQGKRNAGGRWRRRTRSIRRAQCCTRAKTDRWSSTASARSLRSRTWRRCCARARNSIAMARHAGVMVLAGVAHQPGRRVVVTPFAVVKAAECWWPLSKALVVSPGLLRRPGDAEGRTRCCSTSSSRSRRPSSPRRSSPAAVPGRSSAERTRRRGAIQLFIRT